MTSSLEILSLILFLSSLITCHAQSLDPNNPIASYLPKDIGETKGLRDKNALFDVHTKWNDQDMFGIDVSTPPPNSILIPYYHVYIRWSQSPQTTTNIPLTNFKISLHNNPKSFGSRVSAQVKSDWSKDIASNVRANEYMWSVPLVPIDTVTNMSLFYIRIESEGIINSGVFTVFGVTGPLTIWKGPDKVNKTLFGPPVEENDKRINSSETKMSSMGYSFNKVVNLSCGENNLMNVVIFLTIIMAAVALFL
ncbi:14272_t:CDS:1 [Acaulospora morrowiae]|uniref:14272_t:CDS:1 n=1 Tax=Acaulospora morrowiae TaxID=94023 RepID=A0A9N9BPY9_9GLOM|nr:14272_t:CDS:1 [Acaulospora morrowiae]